MDVAQLAVKNVAMYGDTDIFPFPIENAMFFDIPEKVRGLLKDMEKNFDDWLARYPVDCIKTCIPVGYTGFRWATTINPLWNCFLLYQVLKISNNIEAVRLPTGKNAVFSYRTKLDEGTGKIFDQDVNWRLFYHVAKEIAEREEFSHVVRFDISDFYDRAGHHHLKPALARCGADVNVSNRIETIIQDLSLTNVSYGLPVGGNSARILAELLLNSMDHLMIDRKYKFCRFVDDYVLFATSKEDAYGKLNWCAEHLIRNEGLSLQKSKTQVQTKAEFLSHVKSTLEGEEDEGSKVRAEFLKIHIHYDPYSTTANEDYKELKKKLEQFDIISLLKSEIRKSRMHQALGKQLMSAIAFLEGKTLTWH